MRICYANSNVVQIKQPHHYILMLKLLKKSLYFMGVLDV